MYKYLQKMTRKWLQYKYKFVSKIENEFTYVLNLLKMLKHKQN